MFAKNIIILAFSATSALAVGPMPARRQNTNMAVPTEPAFSEPAYLSDMPTLPASIESFVATAVPLSLLTDPSYECSVLNGDIPDWINKLPGSIKSALTSYESALESWSSKHSTDFPTYTYTGTYATPTIACTKGSSPKTGATASQTGASQTGASATGTGSAAAKTGAAVAPRVAVGLAGAAGFLALAL